MKIIDINKQEGVKLTLFNDNQPHVQLDQSLWGEPVTVRIAIRSSLDLMNLMMVNNALDAVHCIKAVLQISYLLGARSDRHMVKGDSFDLRVIADMINSCHFQFVDIVDPHSDVALALIHNSIAVPNSFLVEKYQMEDAILIVPDAGATKKSPKYFEWNSNLKDEVVCIKHRNVADGKLTLKVIEPDKCKDRNCVVIDDLCDGGATFVEIAKQIEPAHLTLIVTHGIFSKGLIELGTYYDSIIIGETYNSFRSKETPHHLVTSFSPWD